MEAYQDKIPVVPMPTALKPKQDRLGLSKLSKSYGLKEMGLFWETPCKQQTFKQEYQSYIGLPLIQTPMIQKRLIRSCSWSCLREILARTRWNTWTILLRKCRCTRTISNYLPWLFLFLIELLYTKFSTYFSMHKVLFLACTGKFWFTHVVGTWLFSR